VRQNERERKGRVSLYDEMEYKIPNNRYNTIRYSSICDNALTFPTTQFLPTLVS
jgi:hypothetical protein